MNARPIGEIIAPIIEGIARLFDVEQPPKPATNEPEQQDGE